MSAALSRLSGTVLGPFQRAWDWLWFRPGHALDLAVARVGCFAWLFAQYRSFSFAGYYRMYEGGLWKPVSFFKHGVPVFEPGVLNTGLTLWHIALACSALGLFTRVAVPVSALGLLYVAGFIQNFGKYTGGGIDAVVLTVVALALSRCGDYLSLDSAWRELRRGQRGLSWLRAWLRPPAPSPEYFWPIRAAWLILFGMYFGAGVSKVTASGFGWGLGDNMRNLLIRHHYSHAPWNELGLWVAERPLLYRAVGTLSLGLEVLCPLGLLHRWLGYAFGFGLLGMQFGIWVLLGIKFAPVKLFVFFIVPWHALLVALLRLLERLERRGPPFERVFGFVRRLPLT